MLDNTIIEIWDIYVKVSMKNVTAFVRYGLDGSEFQSQ